MSREHSQIEQQAMLIRKIICIYPAIAFKYSQGLLREWNQLFFACMHAGSVRPVENSSRQLAWLGQGRGHLTPAVFPACQVCSPPPPPIPTPTQTIPSSALHVNFQCACCRVCA